MLPKKIAKGSWSLLGLLVSLQEFKDRPDRADEQVRRVYQSEITLLEEEWTDSSEQMSWIASIYKLLLYFE